MEGRVRVRLRRRQRLYICFEGRDMPLWHERDRRESPLKERGCVVEICQAAPPSLSLSPVSNPSSFLRVWCTGCIVKDKTGQDRTGEGQTYQRQPWRRC